MTIAGHRTSVTLEQPFWEALKEIACSDKKSVMEIVRNIDATRTGTGSLTSAVRVFILKRVQDKTACSTSMPR